MTFENVRNVIAETLGCNVEAVTMEAKLQEDLGADSLAAMELMMALEEAAGGCVLRRLRARCEALCSGWRPHPQGRYRLPDGGHEDDQRDPGALRLHHH